MTTSYPGAVDNLTNPTPSDTLNSATVPHAAQHANINDAMEAVQSTLGTNPQGTAASVKARLDTLEGVIDDRLPGEANSIAPTGPFPNGYVWVDASSNAIKVWNGTSFVDPSNAGGGGTAWAVASGGTESTITDGGKTYKVHTFNANGTLTVSTAGLVDVLIVGGGAREDRGNGADLLDGLRQLGTGAHPVIVGPAGGAGGATWGYPSSLDAIVTTPTSWALSVNAAVGAGGVDGDMKRGRSSSITGTATAYAGSVGSGLTTPGTSVSNSAAYPGIVVVRYEI